MSDPASWYRERLASAESALKSLDRVDARIALARLGVFGAGSVIAWLVLVEETLRLRWMVVPFLGFVALVMVHEKVQRRMNKAGRARTFHEEGLARVEERGQASGGERYRREDHPCADDLDLFGEASVFGRASTIRTRAGQDTLARWLLEGVAPDRLSDQQVAVRDMAARRELREALAMMGASANADIDAEGLAAWALEADPPDPFWERAVSWVLSVLGPLALLGWMFGPTGRLGFLLVVFVDVAFVMRVRRKVGERLARMEQPCRDLDLLAEVLGRLEAEPFDAPLLRGLQGRLDSAGAPPSVRVAQLQRLVQMLDSRRNQLFAPFAALVFWTVHLTRAVEGWKREHGAAAAKWVAVVGELEALCSLGGFMFENPSFVLPEIVPEGPVFEGKDVGHPLIASADRVTNDVSLTGTPAVLIVSGSNMSGKSTLLRTVGVNTTLALAGAPVCASRLRVSPLSIGATLHIQDSLQAGRSRFFAEISRLKQIVELGQGDRPLLFLLDEILAGTNSHDRLIGGEALVQGLVERGAIGLVSTHDLALARVADGLGERAANVHFEDTVTDEGLVFDYRLKPGVVTRSNALALMRSVGLPV